jgi:hybrid cluster-associated redox disulfide protein
MAQVTRDMLISEILNVDRGLAAVLMNHGMRCVNCPSAQFETLEQAAEVHGMDVDALFDELNQYLSNTPAE